MSFLCLPENPFQAVWPVVFMTLLHVTVYRIAHNDLRVWIAVDDFLTGKKDEYAVDGCVQEEGPGAKSEEGDATPQEDGLLSPSIPIVEPSRSHPMIERLRKSVILVSFALPMVLSVAGQLKASDKGSLDWTLVASASVPLTLAITAVSFLPYPAVKACTYTLSGTLIITPLLSGQVFTSFEVEIAVIPVLITKHHSHGWAVGKLGGKISGISALTFTTLGITAPLMSVMLCSLIVLARQTPRPAMHAALMLAMTTLLALYNLCTARGDDMKMKRWLLFWGAALGVTTMVVLSLLIPSSKSPDTPIVPEEELNLSDKIWARFNVGVVGQDLIGVLQFMQYGYIFSLMVALLRFDYQQSRNGSAGEKVLSADSVERFHAVDDSTKENPTLEPSTSRKGGSNHVCIPRRVSPFSAPTFKSSIIGSYLGTIIAVLIFPTPHLYILWLPATLVGQSLGGALSLCWNNQWKALWRYKEVWKLGETTEDC
ncbi:hypothetical protein QFC22_004727 [Naganishia vaughanmartiniae]|uniref:Uncharacterized protein n=1 Tax=Naganishia vaughanmartiniae TaxID=1424756 RepID=A0ACC2WXA9_9TREE|nr:hypothetical protein QFC22_004727 [Naganishia vaughanmartiniae]